MPGPANTELFDPGMNTPYAAHLTAGVKQEVGGGFAVSADYVYVRGYDQLRRRDLNAPVTGTTVRPNTGVGRRLIHESTGDRKHHALLLSADRRFSSRWRLRGISVCRSPWARRVIIRSRPTMRRTRLRPT